MCRRTKEVGPTVGLPRNRHFVGFYNVPVLAPTRNHPFYTVIPALHSLGIPTLILQSRCHFPSNRCKSKNGYLKRAQHLPQDKKSKDIFDDNLFEKYLDRSYPKMPIWSIL